MFKMLGVNGRLVSYCVNRRVRDTLTEVGFAVNRVAGPVGGKREVLVAMIPAPSSTGHEIKAVDQRNCSLKN